MEQKHLPGVTLISDFQQCHELVASVINDHRPMFLGRIGGSDSDIVIEYYDAARRLGDERALAQILPKFGIVKQFNGYYDKQDRIENIQLYCQTMIKCYLACPTLLVVGAPLLTELLPTTINAQFHTDTTEVRTSLRGFVDAIAAAQQPAQFLPYSYVERILHGQYTLFRLFADILPGKRVLVVSPFAESIQRNFHNRKAFFPNYNYPDFDLLTYNTPITYQGLPQDLYPDVDWFATMDRIKNEVSDIKFDLALLSCGAYTMPLGLHIRDEVRGKAIYGGGCLQLYFGVTGRRYDNPFFIDQINLLAFILPVERDRFLPHVKIGPQTAKDAFGAYF